jgi:two-component system, NtrC family, response regulator AtoC
MMSNYAAEAVMDREDKAFVVGLSPSMQTLEAVISEIAPTNIPILFVGEIGTGKEILANRVHGLSRRRQELFLKVACPSTSPAAVSMTFGLDPNGKGASRTSSVGTAFFDEISELDAACQRALLYALPEDGAGPHNGPVTPRVLSATSRDLDQEVRSGRFRSELFYRINGICLRLPPLRERKQDIPLLVESLLTKHAAELGRPRPSLSPRTLRLFLDHSWPGNIRELANVVKEIVALGEERLAIGEWEARRETRAPGAPAARGCSLKTAARTASRAAERELILKALARTRWNRKRAAQELQISYKSLLGKLKQIAVEDMGTNQ